MQSATPFTFNASQSGIDIIVDLECDLECYVSFEDDESGPEVTVHNVTIFQGDARFNLAQSDDPFYLRLRGDIIAAALGDVDFLERVCEARGIFFTGINGNDPDGRYVEAA